MTPEQISALLAVSSLLKTVGSLPFGMLLLFLVFGPWVLMLVSSNSIAKRSAKAAFQNNIAIQEFRELVKDMVAAQEKRFESVVRMYENNVEVVQDYNKLAGDLTGIITLSTRTLEGLVQKIDNNQFCPIARKEIGKG